MPANQARAARGVGSAKPAWHGSAARAAETSRRGSGWGLQHRWRLRRDWTGQATPSHPRQRQVPAHATTVTTTPAVTGAAPKGSKRTLKARCHTARMLPLHNTQTLHAHAHTDTAPTPRRYTRTHSRARRHTGQLSTGRRRSRSRRATAATATTRQRGHVSRRRRRVAARPESRRPAVRRHEHPVVELHGASHGKCGVEAAGERDRDAARSCRRRAAAHLCAQRRCSDRA